MEYRVDYRRARELLLELARPVEKERVPLEQCAGRILGEELLAAEDVPAFDRSAYDGYAFRAEDVRQAGAKHPVTLRVLEEVPAGSVPTEKVTAGTAAKVLTGAPIPEGADAVVMFEKTEQGEDTVTLFAPAAFGDNVVRAGEDMRRGERLVEEGTVIDAGLLGTLAAQGEFAPLVYVRPRIGILSTGSEVADGKGEIPSGKIRNTSRYILAGELERIGCEPVYLGQYADVKEEIAEGIRKGLASCDGLLLTGGVSAGDYDLTPAAMEEAGVSVLVRGAAFKPGMACAYGCRDGKLVLGLSGNPAAAITNYYVAVLPAMKKLAGRRECLHREARLPLGDPFPKESRGTRFLRGKLEFTGGECRFRLPNRQGNVVVSSTVGCEAVALVPAGTGKLKAGTVLDVILLN